MDRERERMKGERRKEGREGEKQEGNKETKEGKGSLIHVRTENECQEALLQISVERKSHLVHVAL